MTTIAEPAVSYTVKTNRHGRPVVRYTVTARRRGHRRVVAALVAVAALVVYLAAVTLA
jgi:hypothetical protein